MNGDGFKEGDGGMFVDKAPKHEPDATEIIGNILGRKIEKVTLEILEELWAHKDALLDEQIEEIVMIIGDMSMTAATEKQASDLHRLTGQFALELQQRESQRNKEKDS